ncbi:MAG TPA: type II toxin-antitoxin system RelE/ParE family toxin, partial [Bacteroidia bacterium]|nr:type II toxin-antitoxin system RelE/ParE family toxin [Bacteroidia bacterium]
MLQIRWSEKSLSDFIAILDYIKKDSPTNAKRVKTRINNFIKTIPSKPKMFRKDELKQNNDGTF